MANSYNHTAGASIKFPDITQREMNAWAEKQTVPEHILRRWREEQRAQRPIIEPPTEPCFICDKPTQTIKHVAHKPRFICQECIVALQNGTPMERKLYDF